MVFTLISLVSLAAAWRWEEGHPGNCEKQPNLDSLDIKNIQGLFYEVVRGRELPVQLGDCTYAEVTLMDNSTIEFIEYNKIDRGYYQSSYYIYPDQRPERYGEFSTGSPVKSNQNLISADFEKYMIIYVCEDIGANRRDTIDFWSRDVDFDFSPYMHLAYERGFTDDDLYFINHDPNYCA